MPGTLARVLLFLSSYAPLAIIFAILYFRRQSLVAIIGLVAAAVGLAGLALFFALARRLTPIPAKIIDLRRRDDAAASYILGYLMPFLAVAFNDWRQVVAMATFFALLAYVYVSSNMVYINPVLSLVGYHLYEATMEDGATYNLIARGRLRRGDTPRLIQLGEDILLDRRP
jgi:hypothetical protein